VRSDDPRERVLGYLAILLVVVIIALPCLILR
jgi:uncharacterized membrane protein YidH (DUF202 family)